MIVLVLAVAVLGVAALVAVARAVLDDGPVRTMVVVIGAVTAMGLLAVAALGVGLRGQASSEDDGEEAEPVAVTVTTVPSRTTPLRDPVAELATRATDQLPAIAPVLGDLSDGEAIVIGASGLEPLSSATVHQCPAGAVAPSQCRLGLEVTVGEDQDVTVLVDLLDQLDAGGRSLDCTRDACSVVIFGSSRLELRTVFGDPAPPPVAVHADPAALPPGAELRATASGLPPGASVEFSICRPDGDGGADCGLPSPASATPGGTAEAVLEVGAGRCGRGDACAVAVTADGSAPLAYRHLRLLGRGGASYAGGRLGLGLAAAGALLIGALLILRRTDWTPVEGDPFAGVTVSDDLDSVERA